MKFGTLSYAYSTNLGDEIQTLSATQFLPRVDALLERDRLYWYDDRDPTFVICNGWFTEQRSWPPPDSVVPLFVSFHPALPELLVSDKYATYFKQHEPIGCRSRETVEAFRKIGVAAYFSGCLTLTLQRRFVPMTDCIYAVDVDPELFSTLVPKEIQRRAIHLTHEFPSHDTTMVTRVKWNAAYYGLRGIQKWDAGQSVLGGMVGSLNKRRHTYRSQRAEELLRTYSGAKLVVTTRLHCAMPCLALGTPVILLRRGIDADPRFGGLCDLVRTHSDPSKPLKIDWDNPEPNSGAHLSYANALRERCNDAVRCVLALDDGNRQSVDRNTTENLSLLSK